MASKFDNKSPDYRLGYRAGYIMARREIRKNSACTAYWIMRKDGWYCSNCETKHNQAHDEYCCKCGCKMSEEADYEDN